MTFITSQNLKKHMVAMFAEATEQGLDFRDVDPSEVLDQFYGLQGLQGARNQISELKDEAEGLKENNLDLKTQLKRAQQAVANINVSNDYTQLQLDLDQANKSSDFYRNLMKDAEKRAKRYQEKLQEALQKRSAAEEVEKKIERLEAENKDLQQSNRKLAEEMRNMKDIYDKLRDKDLAAVVDKEEKLMAMEKRFKELEKKLGEIQEVNNAVEEQYQEVMSSLDAVVTETCDDLNAAKASARAAEQQQSATFSEIQPLRRFHVHANDILGSYQQVFRQLLNATEQDVTCPSDFREILTARLRAARTECEAFYTVRALFTAEGVPQSNHYEQLSEIAQSAVYMHKSLDAIGQDVTQFLWALERRPEIRKLICLKFKVLR